MTSTGQNNSTLVRSDSHRIGSDQLCYYCGERVGRLKPLVVFGLQKPEVVGAAHPECGYYDFRHAQFSVTSPAAFSRPETSLLAHFYHQLFQLPGQGQPQAAQRCCLAALLLDFPRGLADFSFKIAQFKDENRAALEAYAGDLETDCYIFMGRVWKAAQAQPLDVWIDFT
jgi:hypothetical protein